MPQSNPTATTSRNDVSGIRRGVTTRTRIATATSIASKQRRRQPQRQEPKTTLPKTSSTDRRRTTTTTTTTTTTSNVNTSKSHTTNNICWSISLLLLLTVQVVLHYSTIATKCVNNNDNNNLSIASSIASSKGSDRNSASSSGVTSSISSVLEDVINSPTVIRAAADKLLPADWKQATTTTRKDYEEVSPIPKITTTPMNLITKTNHVNKVDVVVENTNNTIWPNPDILQQVVIDNTIIIVSANCGYIDLVQNWILHMRQLQVYNYIIIAQDEVIYPILQQYDPGHVVLLNNNITEQVKHEAYSFWTKGFYTICQQRPNMIRSLLRQGYNVLYTDSDLVFVKNPLQRIQELYSNLDDVDYIGITDAIDDSLSSTRDVMCTCFMYLRPTPNTFRLVDHWEQLMMKDTSETGNDQYFWQLTLSQLKNQFTWRILPKQEFPPGFMLLDHYDGKTYHINKDQVYTMHANFVIGHSNKVQVLQKHQHWYINNGTTSLTCRGG